MYVVGVGLVKVCKGSRALEEEGVRGSQGGEKDKLFLHCFVLVNITMYLA